MTTTREAALESALRNIAGGNLGDMPWQANYDRIRAVANAAISTPATEPQGYVEGYCKGIDDAARRYDVMSGLDTWDYFYTAKQSMLALKDFAARPAPQPAADTRVDLINRMDAVQACQVGPSDEWAKATKDGYNQAATDCAFNILKIKPAIIGTATPAPSDKIAEAARVLNAACDAMWNDHARLEKTPDRFGQEWQLKHCHIKAISEAQQGLHAAIAGQGETP